MVYVPDSQKLSLERQKVCKLTSFVHLEIEVNTRNRYYETVLTMPSDAKRITGIRIHSNLVIPIQTDRQIGNASIFFDNQLAYYQGICVQYAEKIKPFVFEPCQLDAPNKVKLSYYSESDENPYRVQCTIRYEKEQ